MVATYIYLALALFLFANTLGTLFPTVYHGEIRTPMAFMSMLMMFWIPQWILLGVVVTGICAWLGALENPVGLTALVLHLLSWAILLGQGYRMHNALPILDNQPVRDEDHPFCDGLTDEERRELPRGAISWRPSFTFRIPEMLEVDVARNVVFRQFGRVKLRVDIYHMPGREPRPCAMYIHGGAWVVGNRRQSRYMCYQLAAAGWVVFAVSYRFAPRFPLPAAIEDCKAAVAWIREHGAQYGAMPDQLVVLGGSAGGHLAAMVALTPNEPRFQPGFEHMDTRVDGAVILYGVTDFIAAYEERRNRPMTRFLEYVVMRDRYHRNPELFRLVQPSSWIRSDAPPILLAHGMNDHVVPIQESRIFAQKLRAAGASIVHLLEIPGALHAFEVFPSPVHQRTMRVILRFMELVRNGPLAARAGQRVRCDAAERGADAQLEPAHPGRTGEDTIPVG